MDTVNLIKRRLRHLRSITVENIKTFQNKEGHFNGLSIQKLEYFIAIENSQKETIYVSEVQNPWLDKLLFNELPASEYADFEIILKLFLKVPKTLQKPKGDTPVIDDEDWLLVGDLLINLDQLKRVEEGTHLMEEDNLFLFHFPDGKYIMPEIGTKLNSSSMLKYDRKFIVEDNKTTTKSANFNSILKINKINEYKSHIRTEINSISEAVQTDIEHKNKKRTWDNSRIKQYIQKLEVIYNTKKTDMKKLQASLQSVDNNISVFELNNATENKKSLNNISRDSNEDVDNEADGYGNKSYKLIKMKNRVDSVRAKKLYHLVSFFRDYHLFNVNNGGYVRFFGNADYYTQNDNNTMTTIATNTNGLNFSNLSIQRENDEEKACNILASLEFNKIRKQDILGMIEEISKKSITEEEVNHVNTIFGQYLLFIQIISQAIYNIPLPNKMEYYGSTCFINETLPFYIPEKNYITKSLILNLSTAIDLFNVNIEQVKLHLEYRKTL